MKLVEAFVIAFSMYSRIPMPRVEWKEENMQYAFCFFPAVGAVLGACIFFLGKFLAGGMFGPFFSAALLTVFPILFTGGIHLDGFLDTADALGSCADREKKLEILKDSHAGAFAVLGMGVYLLWSTAVWSEAVGNEAVFFVAACGYVLSRALSGLSVMCFPAARNGGLAKTFQKHAQKRRVCAVLCLWGLAAAGGMLAWDLRLGTAALVCAGGIFFFYGRMSRKQFGGVTGDLAGWFLSVCELGMLTGIVLAERVFF